MAKTWTQISSQLAADAKEKRIPFTLSFELTARCNQQCKMCYVCKSVNDRNAIEKELTAAQWLTIAKEARDAGLFWVTLTGGEVFLRKDFKEIYTGLQEMGLMIQILSNGTLITPEIIKWLKTMPPYMIGITLYGADSETCAQITGYKESYEHTVRAIDGLLEAGINTKVRTTVVRANMHQFEQMCDFVIERGLKLGVVDYISPRREGLGSDPVDSRLSAEERNNYEIMRHEHNLKLIKEFPEHLINVLDSGAEEDLPGSSISVEYQNDPFYCTAGKSSAWITWDGRLVPCGLMSEPVAYPLEGGVLQAWEQLKKECLQIPVCSECSTCKYINECDRCPARLFTETGSYNKPAPYLCALAKLRYAQSNCQ